MKKYALATSMALMLSLNTHAADISVVGTIPTVVQNSDTSVMNYSAKNTRPNIILLQKIKLSDSAKKAFANRVNLIKQTKSPLAINTYPISNNTLPKHINIGMNGTPVLNQGAHGSCVTFATSGALDALIGQGAYISELCSLTLGNYLASNHPGYPSGWNGSYGTLVLRQFFKYGIVSIKQQRAQGCGGLKSYPTWDPSEEAENTTPEEYKKLSENIDQKFEWQSLFSHNMAFVDGFYNPQKVVDDVKESLNKGNRVTFGVLLDVAYGSNGAVGTHHVRNDTWMLTPEIEEDVKEDTINAAHEMIIIGYDDKAIVSDKNGYENKGLFILRNSWSKAAGDQGNYYMTYDHFKLMVMETQSVKLKS